MDALVGASRSTLFGCAGWPLASESPPSPPGRPPSSPSAAKRVRSISVETLQGRPLRQLISVAWPRPPRNRPAPPESVRSSRRCCTSGVSDSMTSAGTPPTPLGKAGSVQPVLRRSRAGPPGLEEAQRELSLPGAAPDREPGRAPPRSPSGAPASPVRARRRSAPGRKWPIRCRTRPRAGSTAVEDRALAARSRAQGETTPRCAARPARSPP